MSDLPAILQIDSVRMHAQPCTCLGRGHLKTAGEAKKTNDTAVADNLLAQIAEIDKIFWETKK